jgi:hypothetical protein
MKKILRYLPQVLEIVNAIEQVQDGGTVTIRPTVKGKKFVITVQRLPAAGGPSLETRQG